MGLRSFALYRDLGGVAELIDIAFSDDEAEFGAKARDEFRALKTIAPFVWFMGLFLPRLRDTFSGFVWEEGGRIVGNASVYRSQDADKRWLIGNVSVLPEYRKRGIARKLTASAIEYARRRGGNVVTLDVRSNNETALRLYLQLGMTQYDCITELVLKKGFGVTGGTSVDEFEAVGSSDWPLVYDLAKASVPMAVQEQMPLRDCDYRPGIWELFEQASMATVGHGGRAYAVEKDGQFEAYLRLDPFRARPFHKLTAMIRPDCKGKYEDMLAARAVGLARAYRQADFLAELRSTETEQVVAFVNHGFTKIRQLLRLGLKL